MNRILLLCGIRNGNHISELDIVACISLVILGDVLGLGNLYLL
jgi:hypothetical protein